MVRRLWWRFLRVIGATAYSWNLQFAAGKWHRRHCSPHTLRRVQELCHGGVLLEHGCAEGQLPHELPAGTFSRYVGFDISSVAVDTARTVAPPNCTFETADMAGWQGDHYAADLIVLEECLYYLRPIEARRFLLRCFRNLDVDGHILVILHDAHKHAATAEVCRRVCSVYEEKLIGSRLYLTLGAK
jgi:trans-aconitate methyltransferase